MSNWRFLSLALIAAGAVITACGENDDPIGPIATGAATLSGDISTSRTLFAETTYTISGFVKVTDGATLTIRPGTVIRGAFNPVGSSLFVLRGARIDAQGTVDRPVVFTSDQPVGSRKAGDWGGLIIIGRGIINRTDPTFVEGTGVGTGNPQQNYAGGTDNTDNSGTLRYVRVEFAGYGVAPNTELNSFTFAAVGSGTVLENLQSLYGLDDSFEWFGGAVNGRYLVSYESGDDHFDAAEGYTGVNQFMIAFQSIYNTDIRSGAGSPGSDPQGIENDGCEPANCNNANRGRSTPMTDPMFANFTLIGTGPGVVPTAGGIGMLLRRGAGGYYVNGVIARWPNAAISIRDTVTNARVSEGTLIARNLLLTENAAVFQAGSNQFTVDPTANNIEASSATTASLFTAFPTTQPTAESAFDWTPSATSPARTGGTGTFTGTLSTVAGAFAIGTTYRGAADPTGAKWWQGWTRYVRN